MRITKQVVREAGTIPLIAALPYEIEAEMPMDGLAFAYDPMSQLTVFAGRRDFSTCRYDESAGGLFSSKSDTQKDD